MQQYVSFHHLSSAISIHPFIMQSKKNINLSSLSCVPQFRQTLKLNQTLCDSLQSYPSISQIPLTEDIVY